ncbi:unnamed protein product (macronuclear) [Paramecium tetraurelia]|uniref:Uncharacterized protein n=1 Tax=Paramecium tetraurelia TaxID=5888 RepID=A0BCU6_PARTE|nr:uncharacterized protein GSPATT00004457001 [Paramecium tetraurelia]CAK56363.1 unnamed protein product [Paramecium tetraurelia]|eukprot:XP_001423761.1 hypothetical protein (macronuclear) [Paramecium tetraurelia strain d4-2]
MNELFRKSFQASTVDTRQRLASRQTRQHQDTTIPKSILDQNGIERWINDILREACLNEKQNSLNKLGLDRSTLKVSAGVKDEDVSRLYRSMFVYTVGFYEMLHEMLRNLQLTAAIWKVFGILLEYVAKGDFQFAINQIQQETQQKIEELNETLTQRETKFKIVEKKAQEEIIQLQNMLQDITDQNNVLKLQRDNAEIDFQQSNTAFEEEVALRIKFEYRINEITSIYRELAQSHSQLFEELQEIRILYDKTSNDLMKSKKKLETVIEEKDIRDNEINHLKQTVENQKRQLDEKENKILIYELKINKLTKISVNDQSISMNYEHQFNQLCMQFSKYKEENIIKLQELEKYQRNYQDVLDLNKKLTNEIQIIKQEKFQLQTENNKYKITVESFEQLEQGYRSSILQLQQENRELIEEHESEIKKFQRIQVEHSFQAQRIQVQQNEILALNQNIQQMKIAKIHLDELFIKEKAQVQLLQNSLSGKEETILDLEKCLSFIQQRLHTLTMEMNEQENKARLNQQDFKAAELSYKKQIEQFRETLDTQRRELINEKDKLEALQNQYESQKKELSEIKSVYKEEVYEKNILVTKQIYSNLIINNDNQKIGGYINEITDLQLKYDETTRMYKQLEIKYKELEQLMSKDQKFLIDGHESKIIHYKAMQKEMVSKMKLEDALSQWDRTNQKLIKLDQSFKNLHEQLKQLKSQNLQMEKENEELTIKLREQITLIQKLKADNNKSTSDLKLIKFKQLVYYACLKDVNLKVKQFSDLILQTQNSNQELNNELAKVKEENLKQKQLIRRYRISAQGQQQPSQVQLEEQDSTNDLQNQQNIKQHNKTEHLKSEKSQDDQSISLNNSILLQNQTKQIRKSKFQIEVEQIEQNLSKKQQEVHQLKLEQLSQTIDLKQSQIENKTQNQPVKLNSLQIKDDLLNIDDNQFSIENEKNQQTAYQKSRSISVSQGSKSQRSNKSQGQMDFVVRVKKNTLIQNAKMNSKQFGRLFQITRDHYQS